MNHLLDLKHVELYNEAAQFGVELPTERDRYARQFREVRLREQLDAARRRFGTGAARTPRRRSSDTPVRVWNFLLPP